MSVPHPFVTALVKNFHAMNVQDISEPEQHFFWPQLRLPGKEDGEDGEEEEEEEKEDISVRKLKHDSRATLVSAQN